MDVVSILIMIAVLTVVIGGFLLLVWIWNKALWSAAKSVDARIDRKRRDGLTSDFDMK